MQPPLDPLPGTALSLPEEGSAGLSAGFARATQAERMKRLLRLNRARHTLACERATPRRLAQRGGAAQGGLAPGKKRAAALTLTLERADSSAVAARRFKGMVCEGRLLCAHAHARAHAKLGNRGRALDGAPRAQPRERKANVRC